MWRRTKQIILPALIIFIATLGIASVGMLTLQSRYQSNSRQETAALIGSIAKAHPDLDHAEIVKALSGTSDPATTKLGEDILQEFGFYADELVGSSSEKFSRETFWLILGVICIILILLISYFWWRDWRDERQVAQLVEYLQRLKDRVYELKLDENTETRFSLLTNEIYKISVLLKENAEYNRRQRQNLETALADISHQLRTPLTSLQVLIDNIYDDPEMPVAVRQDFLRSVGRQIESMSNLVTTLLNLAKFDNGSITLHQLPVKVGELMQEVHQNLAVLADLKDVKIVSQGDLDAKVNLDRRWQAEALTNVVKNCIEHSPSGSEVKISASDSPVFLKLVITDQGEGIAPGDQRHIFERFYRAKNATAGSVGIGLAFAKTVIEADNGQISVASKVGEGTTFTIKYFK